MRSARSRGDGNGQSRFRVNKSHCGDFQTLAGLPTRPDISSIVIDHASDAHVGSMLPLTRPAA
jgi:hypothetical protein